MSELSLDDLWRDAKRAYREANPTPAKPSVVRVPLEPVRVQEPSALFASPDNWQRGRRLILVHADTQTIIGAYDEWTHRFIDGARKLVLATDLAEVDGVEDVAGPGWVETQLAPTQTALNTEEVLLPRASLEKLSAAGEGVFLRVSYAGPATLRAELINPCTFHFAAGAFELPAGTNIFPLLSRGDKTLLRRQA